ncbi:hypothetical protein WJX74_009854 [Apatococcus lobatus]|uniref:Uncharacterized protein n=1 Tax=Apatococcus lobatus TaxID=904363 RepID=A0AAW1Q5U3_9CHLO
MSLMQVNDKDTEQGRGQDKAIQKNKKTTSRTADENAVTRSLQAEVASTISTFDLPWITYKEKNLEVAATLSRESGLQPQTARLLSEMLRTIGPSTIDTTKTLRMRGAQLMSPIPLRPV